MTIWGILEYVIVPAIRKVAPAVAGLTIRPFHAYATCQWLSAGIGPQVTPYFQRVTIKLFESLATSFRNWRNVGSLILPRACVRNT